MRRMMTSVISLYSMDKTQQISQTIIGKDQYNTKKATSRDSQNTWQGCLNTESRNHLININRRVEYANGIQQKEGILFLATRTDYELNLWYSSLHFVSAGMATTEELIYNRLILFINKHNILTDDRYGFRDKMSTEMASQIFIENIQESIDKQLYIVRFIF